jgi:acetolactate synthase-1/2/3 large subunit
LAEKQRAAAKSVDAPASSTATVTGAQSLVKSLEALDVEVIFGIPGGAILPAYDPLFDSKVRHILVRHEQGAGHAATGYAQASGKVGVCMATSGPGATNLVTPDRRRLHGFRPDRRDHGSGSQRCDRVGCVPGGRHPGHHAAITKHNYLVRSGADIPRVLAEAFHLAQTGRPGPVLVDIPKDVLQAQTTFAWPPVLDLPGYRPTLHPHGKQIREAARLIQAARRPVLYVGGGVLKAGATDVLRRLAELTGIPVVTTLMARGAFPDSHPQHLGMPGMHGTVPAVYALQRSDLLITLGARFDDRVTGKLDTFAPDAQVIHADIDPAEIGKNRHADVPIVGDAKHVVEELVSALGQGFSGNYKDWWQTLEDLRERYPMGYEHPDDGTLAPQYVIQRLGEIVGPEAIYCAGVGQHQMWASQFIKYEKPATWLNSGGLGTMGYAVPAAMGAKVAKSGTTVWAIDGDGCFQMTNQELATCALEGIPIKVAVINNGNLGMVRQWQTLFYNERYSNTDLGTHKHRIPDFVKLAEALGCVGLRCETASEVDSVIAQAMAINDAPVVVDFVVGKDAMVWPMVAAGTSNDEIMFARGVRPVFDEDEL